MEEKNIESNIQEIIKETPKSGGVELPKPKKDIMKYIIMGLLFLITVIKAYIGPISFAMSSEIMMNPNDAVSIQANISPAINVLSMFAIIAGFALLIIMIVDAISASKRAGTSPIGLIVFTFILKPYYLWWRQQKLGEKKKLMIAFAIFIQVVTIVTLYRNTLAMMPGLLMSMPQ